MKPVPEKWIREENHRLLIAKALNQIIRDKNNDYGGTGGGGGGTNNIWNGEGQPGAGIGIDGDFYIDTLGDNIYGPKTAGAWGLPASLVGPQGIQGDDGPAGQGVITGGTIGQVLAKASGTDYDTGWVDQQANDSLAWMSI